MKNEFAEFYRPTEKEFEALWKDCLFSFDASVLLNLYFFSSPTATTYITVLGLLKDRLWLPHQAALEYQRNRIGVVSKVIKGYDDALKTFCQLQSQVHSKTQPPFLGKDLTTKLDQLFEEITDKVGDAVTRLKTFGTDDPIRDKLDELFSAKVGTRFIETELQKIFDEGKERYKLRIPPGFKDEKDKPGNDMFGDLVIWKEMIEKSKTDKRPIVFVTDDAKEDWWHIHDDKTFGPRTELLREFIKETTQRVYFYNSESFLRYADQFLAANVSPDVLEEIANTHERDRLLMFELGYEDVETISDGELEAANVRLESLRGDPSSEAYIQAYNDYAQISARKSADTFMSNVHSRLSPGAQHMRAVMIEQIQGTLRILRSKPNWDRRSEYKLPNWLENVPEEMVPYTSLPKLRLICANLSKYLFQHIKML